MISVCMATYNGGKFIREQLQSILQQLPEALTENASAEVIISDDGSTDDTLDVIREFNDARIRILPPRESGESQAASAQGAAAPATPLGPVYNFERALAAAKGDVIFLADQDDVWLPGKVEQMMAVLQQGAGLAVHDAEFIDREGRAIPAASTAIPAAASTTMWSRRPYKAGVFNNWLKNSYTGCCMALKREVLQAALPFPRNLPMHDQWLGLMAERHFSVVTVPKPLIQYRIHEKNATHLTGGGKTGLCQKIRWRLDLLRALVVRG